MTVRPQHDPDPLIDLRAGVIIGLAVLVGALVAATDGIGTALAAGVGVAAALHAVVGGRRTRR